MPHLRTAELLRSVILRDSNGSCKGAWVNHFSHENSYCAESEAAIQALLIGMELNLNVVTIEGDAMFVFLAMQGLTQFEN